MCRGINRVFQWSCPAIHRADAGLRCCWGRPSPWLVHHPGSSVSPRFTANITRGFVFCIQLQLLDPAINQYLLNFGKLSVHYILRLQSVCCRDIIRACFRIQGAFLSSQDRFYKKTQCRAKMKAHVSE